MTGTAPFPIAKAEASWIERSKGWAARKGIVYLTDLTRPLGTFNVPFTRYTVASRFADVQEIMARAHKLPVPYDERSRDAGWGKSFLLAHTQMDHAYWSVRNAVRELWKANDRALLQDMLDRLCARIVGDALADGGRLDGARDYVHVAVPAVFSEYFGVQLSDTEAHEILACAFHIGGYVFLVGEPDEETIASAQHAHARITHFVERSLDADEAPTPHLHDRPTVMARAREGIAAGALERQPVVDMFVDMIIGCATPTVSGAARMLDLMLNDAQALATCTHYARTRPEAFVQCVHESLRMAFIVPGLWRRTQDQDVSLEHTTFRRRTIKPNRFIFMALQSAMYDPRRYLDPQLFQPERSNNSKIVFGYQEHNCIGAFIAETVLTALYRTLLQHDIQRADRTRWAGLIPIHIPLEITEGAHT